MQKIRKKTKKIEYGKLQIQQLVDADSRVSVIDNFKPHIDDKFFKIEQENIYSLARLARVNLYNVPSCLRSYYRYRKMYPLLFSRTAPYNHHYRIGERGIERQCDNIFV